MEILTTYYQTYISTPLLLLILLGGIFATKYTNESIPRIKDRYKVLIVSIFFAVGLYYFGSCKTECVLKYIITYLFATSFYEILVSWIIETIEKKIKN